MKAFKTEHLEIQLATVVSIVFWKKGNLDLAKSRLFLILYAYVVQFTVQHVKHKTYWLCKQLKPVIARSLMHPAM